MLIKARYNTCNFDFKTRIQLDFKYFEPKYWASLKMNIRIFAFLIYKEENETFIHYYFLLKNNYY